MNPQVKSSHRLASVDLIWRAIGDAGPLTSDEVYRATISVIANELALGRMVVAKLADGRLQLRSKITEASDE